MAVKQIRVKRDKLKEFIEALGTRIQFTDNAISMRAYEYEKLTGEYVGGNPVTLIEVTWDGEEKFKPKPKG